MITLGDIPLSDHLILDGLEAAPPVAAQQRRTISGRAVVRVDPLVGGRVLALKGEHHFTLGQLLAIQDLAAAGQLVQLVHHRGTYTVLITGIADPVASFDHADPTLDAWYSCSINLLEVA